MSEGSELQQRTAVADVQGLVLELSTDTPRERVAEIIDRVEWLKRVGRELDQQMKAGLLEWLEQNGELTIGTVRWYVGNKKKVKCRDFNEALNRLLEATGGDVQAIAECLSANALKHGKCKVVLGEEVYEQVFETEIEQVPETGKPKREAKSVDQRFLPKGGN